MSSLDNWHVPCYEQPMVVLLETRVFTILDRQGSTYRVVVDERERLCFCVSVDGDEVSAGHTSRQAAFDAGLRHLGRNGVRAYTLI